MITKREPMTNTRAIYTLEIEGLDDDLAFNPSGIAYRVTVYEHGEEHECGMSASLASAINEALTFAGIIERAKA